MLQKIPAAFFFPGVSQPQDSRGRVARRLARWLVRCWEAQCRRAERPRRFVPYY